MNIMYITTVSLSSPKKGTPLRIVNFINQLKESIGF